MSKIYLINVGANTSHAGQARGPIFPDGSFVYVSFPDDDCTQLYPEDARSYVKSGDTQHTHLDPDWPRLTYGDNCFNRRARALLNVVPGDWLLFWALLWRVPGTSHSVWDSDSRVWCLIGALKIAQILGSGESIETLPLTLQDRARYNAHVLPDGRVESRPMIRVFLADEGASLRFRRAVDLGIGRNGSLLQKVVLSSDGRQLEWNASPKWNSATRACRAILDCASPGDHERIATLQAAIQSSNPDFCGFSPA